ncbi:MAG: pilus assembly protein PilM [Sinobacterium sp.]|nr:pilus assembly protein PilM [Sinobacterium sp.]
MIGKFKNKKKSYLGLDISSAAVKLLELAKTNDGYRVESYAVAPLPPGSIAENGIEAPESVAEALEIAIDKSKTKSRNAAVCVSGSSVITKVIDMEADMSEEEREERILADAEQYIPFPIEDVALDFEILREMPDNEERVEVLLAACRSDVIAARQTVLSMASLTAKVVDIEAYAMERAFGLVEEQIGVSDDDAIVAIVDIGSKTTTLSVLVGGQTTYTREQLFGGQQLTEEIQRRYGLSVEEAGVAKKQGGLPEDYEAEVLQPFLESVVQQIQRSLQFFFSSTDKDEVDCVVLAGGVASMAGLAELVQERVGSNCVVANPFANMAVSSKVNVMALSNDAPALMIACGLAMRSFD